MENQSGFDLENELGCWREALANSPALRSRDVQELETHLRDSIHALEARGLAAEEAFLIATRRLGPSEALQREFDKTNPRWLWFDRALWLLMGFLGFEWITALGSAAGRHFANALLAYDVGATTVGVLSQVITLSIQVAIALAAWRWATRPPASVAGLMRACLRCPPLVILGLVVLNWYRWPLSNGLTKWIAPVTDTLLLPWLSYSSVPGDRSRTAAEAISEWQTWGFWIQASLCGAAFVYFAREYAGSGIRLSLRSGAIPEASPEAAVPPGVLALQRLGLSEQEAWFLTRRREVEPAAAQPPEAAGSRRIWAERGLWLTAGTGLLKVFWPLHDTVLFGALWLASGWLPDGPAAGVLAMILQSLILASFTAIVWRRVTRREGVDRRAVGLLLQWPAVSTIAFLGAAYGLQCMVIWLASATAPTISLLRAMVSGAMSRWVYYGYELIWFNLVPVAVLVWLAYRRDNQPAPEP